MRDASSYHVPINVSEIIIIPTIEEWLVLQANFSAFSASFLRLWLIFASSLIAVSAYDSFGFRCAMNEWIHSHDSEWKWLEKIARSTRDIDAPRRKNQMSRWIIVYRTAWVTRTVRRRTWCDSIVVVGELCEIGAIIGVCLLCSSWRRWRIKVERG